MLQRIIFTLLALVVLAGCKKAPERKKREYAPINIGAVKILPTDEGECVTVPVPEVDRKFNIAEWIEDFQYIPIETVEESFMGQYRDVYFHKDRIYIWDIEADLVCIFNKEGKHIRTVGHKSDAPDGLKSLSSVMVDRYNDHLLLYDDMGREMVYYTLDGDFLYKRDMTFGSDSSLRVIAPNRIISGGGKRLVNKQNNHLGELKNYQVYYMDSLLNLKEAAFRDPHPEVGYCRPQYFQHSSDSGLLFGSHYYSYDYYTVTEEGAKLKYRLDYSKHSDMFTLEDAMKAPETSDGGGLEYMSEQTYTNELYETPSCLLFETCIPNNDHSFYTYYDKHSKKSVSFPNPYSLVYRSEFVLTALVGVYGDYLVGYVKAENLKFLREFWKKNNAEMDEKIACMIDGLYDDDNLVLVLFKFKSIE